MATIQRIPTSSTQPLVGVVADALGVEQLEDVLAGDLGEAGHDEDVGGDDAPAAHPSHLRVEGPRGPGEGRPAVGVGPVHLLVADRDEVHRDEGEDRHDRRLQPDGDDHEAERGRQAVGRGRRGDADDDARDQAERAGLEPFSGACPAGSTTIEATSSPFVTRNRGRASHDLARLCSSRDVADTIAPEPADLVSGPIVLAESCRPSPGR